MTCFTLTELAGQIRIFNGVTYLTFLMISCDVKYGYTFANYSNVSSKYYSGVISHLSYDLHLSESVYIYVHNCFSIFSSTFLLFHVFNTAFIPWCYV